MHQKRLGSTATDFVPNVWYMSEVSTVPIAPTFKCWDWFTVEYLAKDLRYHPTGPG